MHPINCRCIVCMVDRSSLGTPEAKAARESVSDEQVARVLARAKELDAEKAVLVDHLHRALVNDGWQGHPDPLTDDDVLAIAETMADAVLRFPPEQQT